jgi:hypothetical protein
MKLTRESSLPLIALGVIVCFVFVLLLITTFSNRFSSKANQSDIESTGNKAYTDSSGETVYYNPKYMTGDDAKKLLEEEKKNIEQ